MLETNKALTRAFFDCYFTGLLEATLPEGTPREPRHLKQLVAQHYGNIAKVFTTTLLPILLALRFPNYDEAVADMQQHHITGSTPLKLLLRYACGTRQVYEAVTDEYRRQIETLLTGHIQSPQDFLHDKQQRLQAGTDATAGSPAATSVTHEANEAHGDGETSVPTPQALRALARTVITAYATGITHGGGTQLRQPSVFRLAGDAAATLLHNEPFDPWAKLQEHGLDAAYAAICRTQDNYETLLAELTQANEDLVNEQLKTAQR